MNSLGILDLVIGLFFIYFVFSVICTAIVEGIAQWRDWRSLHLHRWISDTFQGALGKKLLEHGLVIGLTQKDRKADYIPANVFVAALLDILHQEANKQEHKSRISEIAYDFHRLSRAIETSELLLPDFRRFLLQALNESQNTNGSLTLLKKRLEDWYGDAMDRLIGTYKKRARFYTWIVAFVVAFGANADTIALCKYLKDNPKTTAQLVNAATKATQDSILYRQTEERLATIEKQLGDTVVHREDSLLHERINKTLVQLETSKRLSDSLYQSLLAIGLPLGWDTASTTPTCAQETCDCSRFWCQLWRITIKGVGLMLTALALTLGAPFWFDMINKLVNIRSSGNKPEDTPTNKKTTALG